MRCRRITEYILSLFFLPVCGLHAYSESSLSPFFLCRRGLGGGGEGGLRLQVGCSPAEGTQRLTKPSEYRRRRRVSEIAPWAKFHSISTPTL